MRLLVREVRVSPDGTRALEDRLRSRLAALVRTWGLFEDVAVEGQGTRSWRRPGRRRGKTQGLPFGPPAPPTRTVWLDVELKDLRTPRLGCHPDWGRSALLCLLGYPGAWGHDALYRLEGELRLSLREAADGRVLGSVESGPLRFEDTLSFHERGSGLGRYLLMNVVPAPWVPDGHSDVVASLLPVAAERALDQLYFQCASAAAGLRPTMDWTPAPSVAPGTGPPVELRFRSLGPGQPVHGTSEALALEVAVRAEGDYLVRVELDGRVIFPAAEGSADLARELRRRALVLHPVQVDLGRELRLVCETALGGRREWVGRLRMERP